MRNILVMLLLCLTMDSVAVERDATQEFIDTLKSMETLQGRFSQRMLDQDGNELHAITGVFRLKRPGYFWWEIDPPFTQVVVGTPQSLKVYDPDLEQMTVHSNNSLAGTPAALMSGDASEIRENYQVKKTEQDKSETFTLSMIDPQAGSFESLNFVFSIAKSKQLSEMKFTDKLGQQTQILVSKVQINEALGAEAFSFTPPTDTDIIFND